MLTDDIGHKYRGKTAFNAFIGHSLVSPPMALVYGGQVMVSMNDAMSVQGQERCCQTNANQSLQGQ